MSGAQKGFTSPRRVASSMLKAGKSVADVQGATGLSRHCLRSMRAELGIEAKTGRRKKLNAEQDAELRQAVIFCKPCDFGQAHEKWSYDAVQKFVKDRFGVEVSKDWVGDMRVRYCMPRAPCGRKAMPGNERPMVRAQREDR